MNPVKSDTQSSKTTTQSKETNETKAKEETNTKEMEMNKPCIFQKAFITICQIMSVVTSGVIHSEKIPNKNPIQERILCSKGKHVISTINVPGKTVIGVIQQINEHPNELIFDCLCGESIKLPPGNLNKKILHQALTDHQQKHTKTNTDVNLPGTSTSINNVEKTKSSIQNTKEVKSVGTMTNPIPIVLIPPTVIRIIPNSTFLPNGPPIPVNIHSKPNLSNEAPLLTTNCTKVIKKTEPSGELKEMKSEYPVLKKLIESNKRKKAIPQKVVKCFKGSDNKNSDSEVEIIYDSRVNNK